MMKCANRSRTLAILKAIGAGAHTLEDISNATLIGKTHLSSYLVRLQDLKRSNDDCRRHLRVRSGYARKGRYHLRDPYFRFYFRFMAPAHEQAGLSREQLWSRIQQDLRAFIGQTASKIWRERGFCGGGRQLPFAPEQRPLDAAYCRLMLWR